PKLACRAVTECDHVLELPRRVDVKQREGHGLRKERLAREVEKNGRVLADRIHQNGLPELRGRLTKNMNAFGFEQSEMRWGNRHAARSFGSNPGSSDCV